MRWKPRCLTAPHTPKSAPPLGGREERSGTAPAPGASRALTCADPLLVPNLKTGELLTPGANEDDLEALVHRRARMLLSGEYTVHESLTRFFNDGPAVAHSPSDKLPNSSELGYSAPHPHLFLALLLPRVERECALTVTLTN